MACLQEVLRKRNQKSAGSVQEMTLQKFPAKPLDIAEHILYRIEVVQISHIGVGAYFATPQNCHRRSQNEG